MKIEIHHASTHPANTMIYCYDGVSKIARIYEEDLFEIMTDRQIERYQNGENVFNLSIQKIKEHCKEYFGISGMGF